MNNSIKLPDFLSHLEVVGSLKDDLELCRAPLDIQIDDPNIQVEDYGSSAMAMLPSFVEAYQRNDQEFLKAAQDTNFRTTTTRAHGSIRKRNCRKIKLSWSILWDHLTM